MTQVCGSRRQGARGIPAALAARDREGADAAPRRPLPLHRLPNSKSDRWGRCVRPTKCARDAVGRPKLLAPIRFVDCTAEGRLRHAAFLGLRSDKSAREVRRE